MVGWHTVNKIGWFAIGLTSLLGAGQFRGGK